MFAFDYECNSCKKIEEIFVDDIDQIPTCLKCNVLLIRLMPAVAGYVKGTTTPTSTQKDSSMYPRIANYAPSIGLLNKLDKTKD